MNRNLIFNAIFLLVFLPSCSFGKKELSLPSDSNGSRQALLQKVPLGTSLENASKLMRSYGLECNLKNSEPFQDYKNIDFLYCQKTAMAFPLICDSVWSIAIVYKKEQVSDILTYYYTSCV